MPEGCYRAPWCGHESTPGCGGKDSPVYFSFSLMNLKLRTELNQN